MSSVGPIAEVSVLIRPDLAAFAAELEAGLKTIAAATTVPIKVVPIVAPGTTAAAAAVTKELGASATAAVHPLQAVSATMNELGVSTARTTVATTSYVEASQALVPTLAQRAAASNAAAAAEVALISATRADTVAAAEDATATEANALAHEQLARGAGAATLTLLGIRGATLAASAPFLVGTAAVVLLSKSIHAAVTEQEAAARVQAVLGDQMAKSSEKWAGSLADAFGLSASVGLKFEGQLANILNIAGFTQEASGQLSQRLVELAADMAAFSNVPIETTLRAISLGLVGNSRGLRQFGVELNAAAVNQRALLETGKSQASELTRQERVQARINLLLEQTVNQQGAAARRSGDLAQQQRILSSNLENLAVAIGSDVIPVLVILAQDLNDVVKVADALVHLPGHIPFFDAVTGFVSQHSALKRDLSLAVLFPPAAVPIALAEGVNQLGRAFGFWGQSARGTHVAISITEADLNRMRGQIPLITNEFGDMSTSFLRAAALFRQGLQLQITITTNRAQTASDALLLAQAAGAPLSEQLKLAKAEVTKTQAALRATQAEAFGPGTGVRQDEHQANVRAAAEKAKSARGDVSQIQGAIAAADKKDATAAKKAAKSKQEILDQQDQDLLTAQQLAQGAVDIEMAHAQHTKSLVDDLAALKHELAVTNAQIVEAQKIHDANLRKETIQQLTLKSIQTQNQIDETIAQQAENRKQRRQQARDRATSIADLNIEIAQAGKQVNAEIAARKAKIRLDQEQLRTVNGDLVRAKQLQLDIVRNRQAIKDLRKATEDRALEAKQLAFAFLQIQSGFAANILSNLLPTGSVAGTVGGTTTAISTPTAPSPPINAGGPQRPPDVGAGLGRAAATAGARGSTAGQMATLITINRHILTALLRLAGQNTHPESATHRSWYTPEHNPAGARW